MVSKQDFGTLLLNKKSFLMQVYMCLAFQLALTYFVVEYMRNHQDIHAKVKEWFWVWFILTIALVFPLMMDLPIVVKIPLLIVFSVLLGCLCIASSKKIPENIIKGAIVATLSLFIILTLVGFGLAAMGINLSFMSWMLLIGLIALIIASIVIHVIEVPTWVRKLLFTLGIVLFSLFIAYDTNKILQKDYSGDFITASISLYVDIINMFTEFVNLDS